MKTIYTFFKICTPILLLIIVLAVLWFVYKWYSDENFTISDVIHGNILEYESERTKFISQSDSLKIITYNMGFAAGVMQHTLADVHPKSFFKENLDSMIDLIKAKNADVVLLQEVDLDSKRSWYFNQLDYIMSKLGWGYAAPVVDWDLYFPLRKERKITKATVVISRLPIISNEYTLTSAKPNFKGKLLNIFYYPLLWKSTMQKVGIKIDEEVVDIYNVHLCVWSREARVAQTKFLIDWIGRDGQGKDYIIGGDFNLQAYIRGTPEPVVDMQKTPFVSLLWDNLHQVGEVMTLKEDSIENIHKHFTFPERKHRYDFIFYSKGFNFLQSEILQTINTSDHLPVYGEFNVWH